MKQLAFDVRIEFFQDIEAGVECELDAGAFGNVGKIPLALRIVSHSNCRRSKAAKNFREVEGPPPRILPRDQNPRQS